MDNKPFSITMGGEDTNFISSPLPSVKHLKRHHVCPPNDRCFQRFPIQYTTFQCHAGRLSTRERTLASFLRTVAKWSQKDLSTRIYCIPKFFVRGRNIPMDLVRRPHTNEQEYQFAYYEELQRVLRCMINARIHDSPMQTLDETVCAICLKPLFHEAHSLKGLNLVPKRTKGFCSVNIMSDPNDEKSFEHMHRLGMHHIADHVSDPKSNTADECALKDVSQTNETNSVSSPKIKAKMKFTKKRKMTH